MKKTIVLINPFTSARYISDELKKAELRSVAIFTVSKEKLDAYFRPDDNIFDQQIFLECPDTEKIIEIVKDYNPIFIINGTESSTHITDIVVEKLLPHVSNDPTTTHFRSDKIYMQEALKQHHLPYIGQQLINIHKLNKLVLDNINFPCFCKPVNGICTIGAFKAESAEDLIKKLKKISTSTNTFFDSSEYLIQEYIDGREFFVDTFSYLGKHYVSSVQQYTKEYINGSPVYRSYKIVESPEIWEKCVLFVKKCLDATQFKNGFAHTEIFFTEKNTFYLIEINPRISGLKGSHNLLAQVVSLKSQTDLLISCLSGNEVQESTLKDMQGHARGLVLFNFSSNPLKNPANEIKNFSSVHYFILFKSVGNVSTNDNKSLADVDLIILLYNKNKDSLQADMQAIFSLERSGRLL